MEISAVTAELLKTEADGIIVGLYEGKGKPEGVAAKVDKALGGVISGLIEKEEIKGKLHESTLVYSLGKIGADKVVIAGLGKPEDLTPDRVKEAVAGACRVLRRRKASVIAVEPLGIGTAGIKAEACGEAITEGSLLGLYTFSKHMTTDNEQSEVKQLIIADPAKSHKPGLEAGIDNGALIAAAVNHTRDMVNEPSNFMNPTDMAEEAKKVAEASGLEVTVLEQDQMKKLGMGALLGVALGSSQPPKFIIMKYLGGKSGKIDIALLGKAITFDSGGISIKPSSGMEEMKGDMSGGASVIAAMGAIAALKPEINVLALVPATENLPGGSALKPGDVLKSMGGKTIEIISTDAEGRLALADALGYAREQGAELIVDVATLTGACVVALGTICTGAFTNNQELMDKVLAAAEEAGEKTWQMPMYEEYKEQNKSTVADIKNVGGRYAGAITAAQFLSTFAGDTPWVHLDIAGTNMTEKTKGYLVKGATGAPVRTLVNLVMNLAK